MPEEKLTLLNLRMTPAGDMELKSLSRGQRKALYDLCTIFLLTFYGKEERAIAEKLRSLIRENTMETSNKCEFDKTPSDRAKEEFDRRLSIIRPK